MCGIVAYLGKKAAQPILIESLKRLEYRGYDSAGIALLQGDGLIVKKTSGRISVLEQIVDPPRSTDTVGIAHTRWATHGVPNTVNAHPHTDYTGKFAVVHNGIIENYNTLRTWLEGEGIPFLSETDTEVISNLIGYLYAGDESSDRGCGQPRFEWAVQQALQRLHGTFGVAILCSDFPDTLIGAKRGSPLILGVGSDEYILASDAAAIVEHTTQAIYLADNEMVMVGSKGFHTKTIDNVVVAKDLKQIEFSLEQIELGGFEHHMLKETP
jgi:glucosamine--fructose-6-phosphate aminotransferase (isomerizing)